MAASVGGSYYPDYFSLEDILATQERIPVEAMDDLVGLGHLDPGSEGADLKKGTKLELPCWAVEVLRAGRSYLGVEVPKTYRELYREILAADPLVVDLQKLGPHYYEFGRHLMRQSQAEGEAIGESLTNTFKARFKKIMDSTQNSSETDTLKETAKMDCLERLLYGQGQATKAGMEEWLTRRTGSIATSHLVTQHRKRRAAFE